MPRFPVKTAVLGIAAAALVAGGVYLANNRPLTVRVAKVEENVPVRVFGLGTVEARIISRIGFEVGAALVELKADHGDRVAKGAPLAALHAEEQAAKVAKAQAQVLSAEVNLKKSQSNVAKAKAVMEQKGQVNRRRQELVERRTVSLQTAEEAQKDYDVAEADLAVAGSEVEVARANVADAKAQAAYELSLLEHHVLTAPFDALVVERHKEVGSVVKAGDPIFTLVAPETVWILAHIDESRSGQITEGQSAEIRLRSLPQQTFKGRVARIGIESDRVSEERRVWVTCQDCPEKFHLGEQAEVLIMLGRMEKALLVPEAAVHSFDGRKGEVLLIKEGRLKRQSVGFGHRTEDARLELTSGLSKGDAVVGEAVPLSADGRAARARN